MGGPPVTPEMANLIVNTWRQSRLRGEDPLPKEVQAAVELLIEGKQQIYGRLPKLRTFQELIREAKKKLIGDTSLEAEWSMGSLARLDMPPETIPMVVNVWKYALATGNRFTVIQAKWVSRLCFLWQNITSLWFYSKWYAEVERVNVLSGKDTSTSDLDRFVYTTKWEYMATRYIHGYQDVFWEIDGYTQPTLTPDRKLIEEILHYKNPHIDSDLHIQFQYLPSLEKAGFDSTSVRVYLLFYVYMINGPKWDDLPPKDAVDLIIRLRAWVLEDYKKSKKRHKEFPFTLQREILEHYLNTPDTLLSIVGYDSTSKGAIRRG